jgi:hypothetical protein
VFSLRHGLSPYIFLRRAPVLPILIRQNCPLLWMPPIYLFSKLSIKQSEIQNSTVCFKPPSYYHNVFTFTLFLPEGRAGVAWELSNKMMLFLSLHPLISYLHPLFIYPSHLSLSLHGFKGLWNLLVLMNSRRDQGFHLRPLFLPKIRRIISLARSHNRSSTERTLDVGLNSLHL